MHDGRQQRRCRAKAGHRIGRHGLQPPRHHGIGGPDKGRDESGEQSRQLAGLKVGRPAADQQQHRAGQPEQRAEDMMRQEPLARQQRREQHDQERPEIVQKPGFGRRRKAQREEIERVIAEQAADADDPGKQRLLQGSKG